MKNDGQLKTPEALEKRMSSLLDEAEQLCNIIARSILTAKQNAN